MGISKSQVSLGSALHRILSVSLCEVKFFFTVHKINESLQKQNKAYVC